jgi:hypothetical protein
VENFVDNETREPNGHRPNGAVPPPASVALVRRSPLEEIRELVTYLQDLKVVCEQLCKATVLPKEMQNPANLQLVLMQGLSMGFTVPQAIRASFIIPPKKEGEVARVGYYVDSLVALVRQSDKCRFFRIEESTSKKHRVVCARTDEPDTVVHVFELTREEAAASGMDKARWRDRHTGQWIEEIKHQWVAMPADMLNARNCGRAVKRTFQDVVFGMNTPDELEEIAIADRQEGEVFASIPRAAMVAKRADVALAPQPAAGETVVIPADAPGDPARGDVDVEEGSGDPAWDEVLELVATLGSVNTKGWLPDDFKEEWDRRVSNSSNRSELNTLAPWIGEVTKRAQQSKTCADVVAHMKSTFNAKSAELKKKPEGAS